jgi:hypothetical protein
VARVSRSIRVALALVLGLLAEAALFTLSGSELVPVIAPVIAMLSLGLVAYLLAAQGDGTAPLEVGTMYCAVVLIYGLYPLVAYLVLGGLYTPISDARLFGAQPDPETVGRLAWYYFIYLASFMVAYFATRRGAAGSHVVVRQPLDSATLVSLVASVLALRAVLLVAIVMFADAAPDDYLATYTRFNHLPLLAQQLLAHASGMVLFLEIALMVVLAQQWLRFRWIIILWIAAEFAMTAGGLGARTELFVLVLAALLARQLLFRRARTFTVAAIGSVALVAFAALGVVRALGEFASEAGPLGVGSASEFDSLFANAYDIDRMTGSGEIDRAGISGMIYFGDILALVPQQVLGTEKFSVATWYVTTYYPEFADAGGGLAFGAIAESLAGAGIVDLVWRAALVGFLFGWAHRYVMLHPATTWRTALYVWLVCFSYQAFRSTTLALLPVIFFRVLPGMGMIALIALLLRGTGRGGRDRVADARPASAARGS